MRPCVNHPELDSEFSDGVPYTAGRELRQKTMRMRWLMGALLAGAVVGAALTFRWRRLQPADVAAVQMEAEKGLKPFAKCGGTDWTEDTCCEDGCACIIQSEYFSLCQAPGGGKTCNVHKAQEEVQASQEKRLLADDKAVQAFKVAKEVIAKAKDAMADLKEAEATYDKYKHDGHDARLEKEIKEKEVTKAKNAMIAAEKAEAEALKKYKATDADVDSLHATAKLRSHGKCGGLYGACKGDGVSGYSACCQEGCICKPKNPSYSQCTAPSGKGACDASGEAAHVKSQEALLVKEKKDHEEKAKKAKELKKEFEKLDKDAAGVRHRAAVAGKKRMQHMHVRDHKKAIAMQLRKEAKVHIAKAKKLKKDVHYASLGIKSWEKAAKGIKCTESLDDEEPTEKEAAEADELDKAHKEMSKDDDEDSGEEEDKEEDESEEEEKKPKAKAEGKEKEDDEEEKEKKDKKKDEDEEDKDESEKESKSKGKSKGKSKEKEEEEEESSDDAEEDDGEVSV